jgi:tetratricopeptide (TPR) repeat protein
MTSSHSGTPAGSRERKVGHESSSVTVERTLDDAHRLLRQGKVDGSIEVYAEVLEERPDDWPAANRLGDLYVQAERLDEAVEQFTRVAQCLWERDLLPKAAALYKKVLKLRPEDEPARDRLAEIALRQGFLVDALAHLTALVDHHRAAGDDEGAIAVEQRIGQLRRRAAEDAATAAAPSPEPDRPGPKDAGELDPHPPDAGEQSSDSPVAATGAAPADSSPQPPLVDPAAETEGVIAGERTEPTLEDRLLQLKMKLIEDEVQAGRLKRARQLVLTVLSDAHGGAERIVDLAKRMAADTGDATVMCVDALLEAARHGTDGASTIAAVRTLAAWVPQQPEGGQWPAERLQRLARIDAAARLELMRRESDAILEAFPDLSPGELRDAPGSSRSPSPPSAVASAG